MKIKRIAAALLAGGMMLSNLVFTAAASEESSGLVIFAAYQDKMNSSLSYWSEDNAETPSQTVTSDGDYTVELNMPDGSPIEQVGHFEVKMLGAADYDLTVTLVSMTIDGNDYDISVLEPYIGDNPEDFMIMHNESGDDAYPDFVGASQITATINITGLGEADAQTDESEAETEEETESTAEAEETEETEDSGDTASASDGPTLAFDGEDWSKYIEAFDDTGSGAYSLKSERDVVYQGASAKLSADLKKAPDYATDSETAMGIVLKAENFGLDNFDGYTMTFFSRFNINVEGLLFDNCAYVYGENADGEMSSPTVKKIIYSATSNVNNYEKQIVTIPKDTNTDSIIIKVPVSEAYTGDVLYLDNLTLLDSDSNAVATLDTYNPNAEVTDKGNVIKQNKKQTEVETKKVDKESDKVPAAVIIIIVVAVVAVAAVVTFLIVKAKKRFY